MDAIFNINRFVNLEKRNILLSKMQYIYIIGALTGLYLLSMLLHILTESNFSEFIFAIAYVVIIGGPCFFEKSITKHRSVFDFILPVSVLERFLSVWLKYVIILPLCIFLVILALNLLTGLIPVESVQQHTADMALRKFDFAFVHKILAMQSIFMAGYFYFKKYAFAKTTLILLLVFVLLTFIGVLFGYFFLKGETMSFNANMGHDESYNVGYDLGRSIKMTELKSGGFIDAVNVIIGTIFPLGMWVVSYFKLRETEI